MDSMPSLPSVRWIRVAMAPRFAIRTRRMGAGMVHLPRVVSGRPEEVLAPVGSSRPVLERPIRVFARVMLD
jgi:hypothetical protein